MPPFELAFRLLLVLPPNNGLLLLGFAFGLLKSPPTLALWLADPKSPPVGAFVVTPALELVFGVLELFVLFPIILQNLNPGLHYRQKARLVLLAMH